MHPASELSAFTCSSLTMNEKFQYHAIGKVLCSERLGSNGGVEREGEHIILSALNMAEDLQKPLQDILKKLEKLDAIEEAVINLGKSLQKLEGRILSKTCMLSQSAMLKISKKV